MASSKQHIINFLPLLAIAILASHTMARTLHETSLSISQRHDLWMAEYGRIYEDAAEKEKRFNIFKENAELVESFNSLEGRSYTLSLNQFADLTNDEFKAARNGLKLQSQIKAGKTSSFMYENVSGVPSTVDWRKKGVVTPIKDQGQCGSCWAFSAVAAMEGVTKLKTGTLLSLSEQELIDCDTSGEDEGCQGGLMDDAFDFIQSNGGLTTETNYPYQGVDAKCNSKKESKSAAKIKGHQDVPANNEKALLKAVANQPISVAIDAGGYSFQLYSKGVFTGDCGIDLDHGVAAVGYGTADDGTKYWLVKNSWGTSWGENGYIRMQRDVEAKEGLCGIAMQASYPTA